MGLTNPILKPFSWLASRTGPWSQWPADGRFVAFHSASDNLVPHDTNGADDVFVRGPLR